MKGVLNSLDICTPTSGNFKNDIFFFYGSFSYSKTGKNISKKVGVRTDEKTSSN